ncbi:MAG TPA: tRNA lysidine(34) synthetase TilS [Dehalococcoidales bacterium]|nr:tRNA lysidine(34) synthetase TilS [Dehalococcoidales bacterium]
MARTQKIIPPVERVENFLQANGITDGKPLLVAVSGGPDSVCLLHILHTLSKKIGLKLYAAHLDHGLRSNSAEDAQYVLDFCHKLGIPVTIEQANVKKYQKQNKLSLEEAAREVRYDFLSRTAHIIGTNRVAIGHTQNDHIETILLHIIRGSGTRGLRGLQPVTERKIGNKRLTILRPLFDVTRAETNSYCSKHRLQPRVDSTNMDTALLRNRVRLKLLPELVMKYNSGIYEALLRTAVIAGDDLDFIDKAAGMAYKKYVAKDDGILQINRGGILKLHPALQRALLRKAVENSIGTLKDIEAVHLEDMVELLTKPAGKRIHLPYNLVFETGYDTLLLKTRSTKPPKPAVEVSKIALPGRTVISDWQIETKILTNTRIQKNNPFVANLDANKIDGELSVRSRSPGDRFQPLGLAEQKKVGQFMIDARIPQSERDNVPVVCASDKITWVVGYRIDESFKITESTKKVLRISFKHR